MPIGKTVLRAGVVGAGTGGLLSLRALQASEHYELVGVADLRPGPLERVSGEFPGLELYASGEGLLEAASPDVVCVSTFAGSHAEVAEQAMAAGVRGLLLEKPVCDTWASGQTVLDQLKRRGLPVVVMIASGQADYELPELSLAALEICEAAYVSNRHRCAVRLPLAGFVAPPQVSWDPGAPYRGKGGRDGRAL
jgi:Oxidoreductase family, NAD-binding Rossmann fold